MSFAGVAAAAPIGKDGKIYACYKVKGKPKGAMRILPKAKARCKRGERKVAWVAVSPGGQTGASGQDGTASGGSTGGAGSAGTTGSAGSDGSGGSTLETKVSSLSLKVDGLEDVLGGVTEAELTEAIDSMELVDELCDQAAALTDQVNALETVIEGLGLNSVLELAGGLLEIPELPGTLDPLPCPSV